MKRWSSKEKEVCCEGCYRIVFKIWHFWLFHCENECGSYYWDWDKEKLWSDY